MTSRFTTLYRHVVLGATLIVTGWGYGGPVFAAETLSLAGQWRFCPDDGRRNGVPTSAFDTGAAKELTYLNALFGGTGCPIVAAAPIPYGPLPASSSTPPAVRCRREPRPRHHAPSHRYAELGRRDRANIYPGSMGTSFRVNAGKKIVVTQLGFFDAGADGSSAAHTVTISDGKGVALRGGSVSIPGGSSAPLSGNFRFAPLATPLTLGAGVYTVWGDSYAVDHCYRPDQLGVQQKWHGGILAGAVGRPADRAARHDRRGETRPAQHGEAFARRPLSSERLHRAGLVSARHRNPRRMEGQARGTPSGTGPLGDPRLARRPRDRHARQPDRPSGARPGQGIAPGKHTFTIRVDNSPKFNLGGFVSILYEGTQTNWNGIVGRMELRAVDPVSIEDVQVYPDVDHKLVTVGSVSAMTPVDPVTRHDHCNRCGEAQRQLASARKRYFYCHGQRRRSSSVERTLVRRSSKLWDEFSPEPLRTASAAHSETDNRKVDSTSDGRPSACESWRSAARSSCSTAARSSSAARWNAPSFRSPAIRRPTCRRGSGSSAC